MATIDSSLEDSGRSPEWITGELRKLDPTPSEVERLSRIVIEAARRLTHSRTELHTDRPGITVTDGVIKRLILRRVRRGLLRSVLAVDIHTDEGSIVGIELSMRARFDDDMAERAQRIRTIIGSTLVECLGPRTAAAVTERISVHWADLEDLQA
ncbi:hypothetical protein [Williamsia sp. CHRR-6]|uniref:hypothetical protein n=1 Tax=Williamsia sp. CHRR-6 TaxID=2835871 RepID=UPI001BD91E2F|nr:hypothetical protein [Williamsia sp. CHRR-6]MBT0567308.1 hypothetical protein [Williamsia sp. CHRR-6]